MVSWVPEPHEDQAAQPFKQYNGRHMMGEMLLEDVGLLDDCTRHRLRPRPAFPHRPLVKLA